MYFEFWQTISVFVSFFSSSNQFAFLLTGFGGKSILMNYIWKKRLSNLINSTHYNLVISVFH